MNNIPASHHRIMPYLFLTDAKAFALFMKSVFDLEPGYLSYQADGHSVRHGEMQLGDSTIMYSQCSDSWPAQPGNLFVYVEDADESYRKALEAGAESLMPPADQDYGRSCGVKDPTGNTWWITSLPEKGTKQNEKKIIGAILGAGLLTGLLDGAAAVIQYMINTGKNPLNVFRFIASGVFGRAAFDPALPLMPVWGILFHMLIATLFTAACFLLYPHVRQMAKRPLLAGVFYGMAVWLVMNLLVVPLSKTPPLPFRPLGALTGMLILVVAVGIPATLLARKFHLKNS